MPESIRLISDGTEGESKIFSGLISRWTVVYRAHVRNDPINYLMRDNIKLYKSSRTPNLGNGPIPNSESTSPRGRLIIYLMTCLTEF